MKQIVVVEDEGSPFVSVRVVYNQIYVGNVCIMNQDTLRFANLPPLPTACERKANEEERRCMSHKVGSSPWGRARTPI